MELESHFEFISEDVVDKQHPPEVIRIKGTRVGIEIVIEDYLEGASPEEIMQRYRSLSLKQIYATITYYLFNQEQIDAYLEMGREMERQAVEHQRQHPHPGVKRILEIKAQREAVNA